ncbi:nuclear transport factor 2 family protein [Streptomyces sp. NPDC056161]|uniref:nuclear transport factor 2 family protein n=1 Tax=unclassified Streptomyces TaxID=2593676 RepID=UPI0035DA0602
MNHARISEALRALVFEPDPDVPLHEVLDRYYAPDYTHRSDGRTMERAEFTQLVARIRTQVTAGTVTVLDELRDGSAYAERHVFRITLRDGSAQHREIAVFGTLAEDGRFRHLSETGFDTAPDETR